MRNFEMYEQMTNDELLMHWKNIKTQAETLKITEADLRKYIVQHMFPNAKEGTNNQDLGNGYKLKAEIKYNYKIDNNKIDNVLEDIATMGNEGSIVAERLIKWTPSLSLTEYRDILNQDIKKKIDSALTITDAMPTLSIIEPKTR